MRDLISRQAAIDHLITHLNDTDVFMSYPGLKSAITEWLSDVPSTQSNRVNSINDSIDLISRQDVLKIIRNHIKETDSEYVKSVLVNLAECVKDTRSAEPESLSQAYAKAVWTWLLNYQIKAAELQGRYSPYEVLSWVANDWRKENDLDGGEA